MMRFHNILSQNNNTSNGDIKRRRQMEDESESDYPQTVEIPPQKLSSDPSDKSSSSGSGSPLANNFGIPSSEHHDSSSDDSDNEGYDEFIRICMGSSMAVDSPHIEMLPSKNSQNKDVYIAKEVRHQTAMTLGSSSTPHNSIAGSNKSSHVTNKSSLALRRIIEEGSVGRDSGELIERDNNDRDTDSGHGVSGRHNSAELCERSDYYQPAPKTFRESLTSSSGYTFETAGGTKMKKGRGRRTTHTDEQGTPTDGFNVRAAFEKEHRAVRKFKVVVVLVLIVAAVAVTVLVYKFTSNAETQNLQLEYNDYALKFITNFHHLQVMRQWAAYTIAGMFTAQCINGEGPKDRPWPNITLPDFANQVRGALVLSHGTTIEFSPLFPNNETIRKGWEAYAVENEATIMHIPAWGMVAHGGGHGEGDTEMDHGASDSGHEIENGSTPHEMSNPETGHDVPHSEELHGDGDTEEHSMPEESFGPDMADAMQAAITDEEASNLRRRKMKGDDTLREAGHDNDTEHSDNESMAHGEATEDDGHASSGHGMGAAHPRRPIEEGIYTMDGASMVDESLDVPLLAPAWQIFPLMGNEGRIMYNEYAYSHKRAIDTMLATNQPALSDILVGSVGHHHYYKDPSSIMLYPVHATFDDDDKTLVGFISVTFSWIGTFWNILPENVRGIVMETSTGQKTSFRVDGKFATFIGEGDHHDPKYDHMQHSSSVYRVYGKENDVKEMVGHHRTRYLMEMEAALHDVGDDEGGHNNEETTHSSHPPASDVLTDGEHIDYMIHIYPSDEFETSYLSNQPRIFALAVSLVFFFTCLTFVVYDCLVERRQKKLLEEAERSGKIVDSLFPAGVRDRLFHQNNPQPTGAKKMFRAVTSAEDRYLNSKLVRYAGSSQEGDSESGLSGNLPPIADLYNDTTVMFADIAGFTAWSSEREPSQVFQLLESLFCDFDAEARSMKVFKIETIGDCYVAVTGLPDPSPFHAVTMAKFAQRCLVRFSQLTKELELSLGPGTADLGIRIGLHSGPVTAGVLRGEKARFQLFGDTMNTASRMESTSIKNMIQVTSDTAALLKKSGKGNILIAREGLIKAKGKGYLQTFWLRPKAISSASSTSNFSENVEALQAFEHEVDHIHSRAQHDVARAELGLPSFSHHSIAAKSSSYTKFSLSREPNVSWSDTGLVDTKQGHQEGLSRLIKWNTKVLESILTKVVIQRNEKMKKSIFQSPKKSNKYDESTRFHEEIAQAVDMPRFNREAMSSTCLMPSKEKVNLIPPKARGELRAYVASIASMYRNVHFHSFEHAAHVTMSAQKLINKVVLRNSQEFSGIAVKELVKKSEEADLFFSTYGISADPLAQFAVVFAALVHDVDHTGVPNVQLITENTILAEKYKNKSVAENNSIQVAWSELLKPEFSNLRKCIFGTDDDELRFRQLLINVVIATDIADRERRAGEGVRWKTAFCNVSDWEKEWQNKSDDELPEIDVSLKATVVLEQIVLASDVAHTMQHWLTYVKWNERLYKEMWAAYSSGRAEKDPTENWYRGEIGFFDGYIIPLATKLKECGVFGTAGDEYLGNALRNKTEWIEKGEAIVEEFEAKIKMRHPNGDRGSITTSEIGSSTLSTGSTRSS